MADPRLTLITGMLDLVPDGCYAVLDEDQDRRHVDFVRITRPDKGKYKDTIKVQTQHAERWEIAAAYFPAKPEFKYGPGDMYTSPARDAYWSVYRRGIVDLLMRIIADHHRCARLYSVELQKCCRCSTTLTDDRSRHYLIGPECETKAGWSWAIEEVDDINGGLSFEALVARGLPTRVWQEKVLA